VTQRIEDYGLVGDLHSAALIGRDGSVDWLCLPRFDSDSVFARILGDDSNGRWQIAPQAEITGTRRRYRERTMILETEMSTASGTVRLVDFMAPRHYHPRLVRMVEGLSGQVDMMMDLVMRFGYGRDVPWVHTEDGRVRAVSGPNALCLDSEVETTGEDLRHQARFTVGAGQTTTFVLSWHESHLRPGKVIDPDEAYHETAEYWNQWCGRVQQVHGDWEDQVLRSLMTLKALTYTPTGGIVAAATTSLPEAPGGERNWDYRYCWVRDATLTLDALMEAGCTDEASAWMGWLVRAAAGMPEQLQIMYGPAGERRLSEFEVDWLPGYENSRPVRVGNAASEQFQLDVYGELMDATDRARHHRIDVHSQAWSLQRKLMQFVEDHWSDPDDGIWEVRGPRQHFTHSRVMAWVAFDRAVRAVERYGLEGPVDRWRQLREQVHDEVCEKGWNEGVNAFTQYYGSTELDASVLMIPLVGFLPADDKRVVATVDAIQDNLVVDGFVLRYQNSSGVDGLSGKEGAFLPCTFWLADCLAMMGRMDEARATFERLLALANDLGLFSEEYDVDGARLIGNFPQAFTHVGLINTARNLAGGGRRRGRGK
jgi:GH15 family glucan-1,4-alpha-glucosidase